MTQTLKKGPKKAGESITYSKRRPVLTPERSRLIAQWENLSTQEKANWGYSFSNYVGEE